MAFLNPSFETAGASPGAASGWTHLVSGFVELFAAFGADDLPWETFEEEWSSNETYLYAFVGPGTDLDVALFFTVAVTPRTVEAFAEGWDSNEAYLYGLTTAAAPFDTTPENFEDFEEEWSSNETYLYAFVGPGTDLDVALFGADTFDGFEATGWDPAYLYAFVGPGTDLDVALFDVALTSTEDFEDEWVGYTMVTI